MSLSLCLFTSGPPPRVHALLTLLRPHCDEIVLAVDRRSGHETLDACAALADRRFAVDVDMMEEALSWLMRQCRGNWILRLDSDEVPSRALLDGLADLTSDRYAMSVPLTRRWLFPDARRYVVSPPWQPDYQVRLIRNLPGAWRIPGIQHTSVEVVGDQRLVDLPIYHADLVLETLDNRLAKASRYELLRPGHTNNGFPVNELYAPERHGVETAVVPPSDRELIDRVLAGSRGTRSRRASPVRAVERPEIERFMEQRAVKPGAYRASLSLVRAPASVAAGSLTHHELVVENLGDDWWPRGGEAQPAIRVGCLWRDATGKLVREDRDYFTETVLPGRETRLMLALRAPEQAGTYALEIDLVHELVRWFGCGAQYELRVEPEVESGFRDSVPGTASPPRGASPEPT